MKKRVIVAAGLVIALVSGGVYAFAEGQQDVRVVNLPEPEGHVSVVCAPCAGEPFGASGMGMVVMKNSSLYFFSLDRSQAKDVTTYSGGRSRTRTLTEGQYLVGIEIGGGVRNLVWPSK